MKHTCSDKNKDGKCDTCGVKMGSSSKKSVVSKAAANFIKGK